MIVKSKCPLTGEEVDMYVDPEVITYTYETPRTGQVKFSEVALSSAVSLTAEEKYILIGVCRNSTMNGTPPRTILFNMFSGLKNLDIPYSFEDRARHFLMYLFGNGGKQYAHFDINSERDSAITYSSPEEFVRIIRALISRRLINVTSQVDTDHVTFYSGLVLTEKGILFCEKKGVNKDIVFSFDQTYCVGDPKIDPQLEHARELYYGDNSTFEKKRSACEVLSYVLEPLRDDLKNVFNDDTDLFFRLVNTFDVRHNKETTKKIVHEEQLEWVYVSLMNTISTYFKLKSKLS